MTVKWAAVGLLTAAYMVVGSLNENRRPRRAYGERYRSYHSRVPQLLLVPVGPVRRRFSRSAAGR